MVLVSAPEVAEGETSEAPLAPGISPSPLLEGSEAKVTLLRLRVDVPSGPGRAWFSREDFWRGTGTVSGGWVAWEGLGASSEAVEEVNTRR